MPADSSHQPAARAGQGHTRWVRTTHWVAALSILTLAVSGFVILMAHPRLYWGTVGNDLTPVLLELPISRNHRHGGWRESTPFFPDRAGSAITASRTYNIFNQNGWARSLHFLAAWLLVTAGSIYIVAGTFSGHIRRNLLPRARELAPRLLWKDLVSHLRARSPPVAGGPPYNLLQKHAYCAVALLALPVMVLSGLAMSPALNAAYPWLSGLFGGSQSARTLHFFTFVLIVLFVLVHVAMVVLSGFRRQMRGMTLGN